MRLFSIYPAGRAGIALLLMRISLALVLTQTASREMSAVAAWASLLPWLLAAGALCGAATTPVAGVGAIVLIVLATAADGPLEPSHACAVLNAVALVLLGPGAYSLDARLFGRRRVDAGRDEDPRRP